MVKLMVLWLLLWFLCCCCSCCFWCSFLTMVLQNYKNPIWVFFFLESQKSAKHLENLYYTQHQKMSLPSFKLSLLIDYKDENFVCLHKKVFENIDAHNKGLILLCLLHIEDLLSPEFCSSNTRGIFLKVGILFNIS